MFLLDQSYKKMAQFCENLPPLFEQPDLSDFVDLILEYFEVQTGQHKTFTDVIYLLLDQALEILDLKQAGNVVQDNILQASKDDEGWISGGEESRRLHFMSITSLVSLSLDNGSNLAQVCLPHPEITCVLRTKLVLLISLVMVQKSMSRFPDRYLTPGQLLRILKQLSGVPSQL